MPWYKRCGCDCHNFTTLDEPCEDRQHITCCLDCPDGAPSAYAVLFECCIDCLPSLLAPPFMLLWKDCLFDCFWSSRVCEGETPAFFRPQCTADFADLCGIFNDLGTLDFPHTFDGCGDIPIYHPSGSSDIGAFYDLYGLSASEARQIVGYLDDYTFVAWQLEVVGDGIAELRAYCRNWFGAEPPCVEGEIAATYICEEFVCLGRNTFHRVTEDGYPVIVADPESRCIALPNHVCVVPAVSQWRTPCDTAAHACACCDPGADSSYLDVDLGDCGGLHEDVLIERNATLPTGVTDPSAPCGYFWGLLTNETPCDAQFGVLTYCDGEDWHVDLWCNFDGGGWNEIDTAIAVVTECCPGATYTWTWSGDWGDCCCPDTPPVDVTCCDTDIPGTLYATISSSECAEFPDRTVALTNDGVSSNPWKWISAPFDSGDCGDSMTIEFHVSANPMPPCIAKVIIKNNGNICLETGSQEIDCPFTSEAYTGLEIYQATYCPCCLEPGDFILTVSV